MLVEKNLVDEVLINFLIVGHTHSSLDQWFSVFSKRISASKYIGTPLSMEYLLQHSHTSFSEQPLVYKAIQV